MSVYVFTYVCKEEMEVPTRVLNLLYFLLERGILLTSED